MSSRRAVCLSLFVVILGCGGRPDAAPPSDRGKGGQHGGTQKPTLEQLFTPEEIAAMRKKAEEDFWATLDGKRGTAVTLETSNVVARLREFQDGYKPFLQALEKIPDDFEEKPVGDAQVRNYYNSHALLMNLIAAEQDGVRAGGKMLCFRKHVPNSLMLRYARHLRASPSDDECRMVCGLFRERGKPAKVALPILKEVYAKGRGSVQDPILAVTIKELQAE